MVTAPRSPGARDDGGLALVVAGIQHLVRDLRQQRAEPLGFRDAGRAHQDRLPGGVMRADLCSHGVLLFGLRRRRQRRDGRRE